MASAAGQPPVCLFDADGDGHPAFGHTVARTDYEYRDGRSFVARSTGMAFADFDRDGKLDAVVTNVRLGATINHEFYLTLLHGRGDGVFDPMPAVYPAGLEATAVEAADLNGDGWPDAVTANGFGDSISVHLNAGDGTLLPRVEYGAGQQPRSLKVADLDGDHHPDVVCLNCVSSDVSVFHNQGDGSFAPEVRTFVGDVTPRGNPNLNFPYPGPFLDVGDLDGNGSIDVAVPACSRIKILLNDGHGALGLSPALLALPAPYQAYAVVIADFDRDGRLDIAASLFGGPPRVALFRNIGNGRFAPAVLYDATNTPWCPTCIGYPTSLSAADLDGDGYPDLAVGHELGATAIILRNRRDGTFAPAELCNVFDSPWFVRPTDLNADDRADLAVLADTPRGALHVVLSDAAGRPINYEMFPPGGPNESRHCVAVADLDGDGDPDLVIGMRNPGFPGQVRVVRNDGGQLTDMPPIALAPPGQATGEAVAIADLNHDGKPDIVVADAIVSGGNTSPGKVWVLLGIGDLTFQQPVAYPFQGMFPMDVAIGDLNDDGRPDLAIWACQVYPGNDQTPVERRILTLLNNGDGTFSSGASIVIDTAPWFPRGGIAVANLSGHGHLDVVATSGPAAGPGKLVMLRNLGGGTFAAPEVYAVASHAQSIAVLDIDHDGQLDLAIAHNHNFETSAQNADAYLTLLYNDGSGTFSSRAEFANQSFLSLGSLAVANAAPGQPRLVVPAIDGQLQVMLEGAAPAFLPRSIYASRSGYEPGVAIVDLDGDGRPDIVHVGSGQGYTVVLRNRSCVLPCYPNCDGSTTPPRLSVADFVCFLNAFVTGDPYANCDGSTTPPVRNVLDFICFLNKFAAGCP